MRNISMWTVMVFSGVVFGQNLVLAADDGPPQHVAHFNALWPMIGVCIATLYGWGVRKIAGQYTFFHSSQGAAAIACIGSVLSAVMPLMRSGWSWATFSWTVLGGFTAFFGSLNPSSTYECPPAKSPSARIVLKP